MKSLFAIALMLLMAAPSISQKSQQDLGLPELHRIQTITLSPSYSCRSKEDFSKGWVETGLFLSRNSRAPEVLFNGACGAMDYLQGGQGGADMTVIADLGKVKLEDLSTVQAFNVQRVHTPELYTRFAGIAVPEVGHTYAVVINTQEERGLFYFTITGYIPNKRLDLRYVVKQFELFYLRAQSPGFDWARKSN